MISRKNVSPSELEKRKMNTGISCTKKQPFVRPICELVELNFENILANFTSAQYFDKGDSEEGE